jgi:hypothetical protein
MNGGIAVISVFMLVALFITVISVTQGHPVLLAIAMLNALIGVIVGLPLVVIGKTRVGQASRLLSGEDLARANSQRRIEPYDESERRVLPPPGSVTDRTTLDLGRHRKV